jgi:hypothetical protein
MRNVMLTFGLIAGAILSAMLLVTIPFQNPIGFDRGAINGYTTMVLVFLLIDFGVRSYRDNVAGGSVRFGRTFQDGATAAQLEQKRATFAEMYTHPIMNVAIPFLEPLPVAGVGTFAVVTDPTGNRMGLFEHPST